jgi:hypothetical protein
MYNINLIKSNLTSFDNRLRAVNAPILINLTTDAVE